VVMYSSHEGGNGYMLSLNSFGYLTRPQGYDRREIVTNYWSDISCFV